MNNADPRDGRLRASLFIRIIYGLTLLELIVSSVQMGSGTMGLVFGGGIISLIGRGAFLVLGALLLFRTYQVLRYPAALDARRPNPFGVFLRYAGLLLMGVSALSTVATFVLRPITRMLFQNVGDNGIAYFVVGVVLVLGAGLGWLGCLAFELSRVVGPKPDSPAPPWAKLRQDLPLLALMVAALSLPMAFKAATGGPCGKGNTARCVSTTESSVKRVVGLSAGQAVALESEIDEIELRRAGREDLRAAFIESPAMSLTTAGYVINNAPETRVRVKIGAAVTPEGVLQTVTVFDGTEETARFITRYRKDSSIEKSSYGARRIVAPTPAYVEPGSRSQHRPKDGDFNSGFYLDQMFLLLRSAIGTEQEAIEWPSRVVRQARLVIGPAADGGPIADVTQAAARATCSGIASVVVPPGMSFDDDLGWQLSAVSFRDAPPASPPAGMARLDTLVCRNGEAWIISYATRAPEVRLRHYAADGKLLGFIDTTLPAKALEQLSLSRVGLSDLPERPGKVLLQRSTYSFSGGKESETERETFEVDK